MSNEGVAVGNQQPGNLKEHKETRDMIPKSVVRRLLLAAVTCFATVNIPSLLAFPTSAVTKNRKPGSQSPQSTPFITALPAQISQQEASKGIDKVVAVLRKDKAAIDELGRLERVTVVLGYGSPSAGSIAVRFNAAFKRSGFGRSSVPMAFGLGQTNTPEGRGTMVGQVKATVDVETGKVTSCSVFRDLGYGRSFNLKL